MFVTAHATEPTAMSIHTPHTHSTTSDPNCEKNSLGHIECIAMLEHQSVFEYLPWLLSSDEVGGVCLPGTIASPSTNPTPNSTTLDPNCEKNSLDHIQSMAMLELQSAFEYLPWLLSYDGGSDLYGEAPFACLPVISHQHTASPPKPTISQH